MGNSGRAYVVRTITEACELPPIGDGSRRIVGVRVRDALRADSKEKAGLLVRCSRQIVHGLKDVGGVSVLVRRRLVGIVRRAADEVRQGGVEQAGDGIHGGLDSEENVLELA